MEKKANEKATPTQSKVMGCLPQIIADVSRFDYSIDHSKRKGGKKRIPLFALGQVTITQGVEKTIPVKEITAALSRHQCGDWGDTSELGSIVNNYSLQHGIALLSEYDSKVREDTTFWIITNDHRTATTILLPEEYW
jgi:hypothetical protein